LLFVVSHPTSRLRADSGQGLIELLIALTILVIGIGATTAVFAGSILTLQHGGKEGTALTLADRQVEAYRALAPSCVPFTTSATASAPTNPNSGSCPTPTSFPNPYAGSQTPTSSDTPDHRSYTVTTTVQCVSASCSTTDPTSTIQIRVTVTEAGGSTILARETSNFSKAASTS
jgi:type II secretory pathway pseudopilin PulG